MGKKSAASAPRDLGPGLLGIDRGFPNAFARRIVDMIDPGIENHPNPEPTR